MNQGHATVSEYDRTGHVDLRVLASEEGAALPPEIRAFVIQARFRYEFNRSSNLLHLGRCDEAAQLLGAVLAGAEQDADLRPRLLDRLHEIKACVVSSP